MKKGMKKRFFLVFLLIFGIIYFIFILQPVMGYNECKFTRKWCPAEYPAECGGCASQSYGCQVDWGNGIIKKYDCCGCTNILTGPCDCSPTFTMDCTKPQGVDCGTCPADVCIRPAIYYDYKTFDSNTRENLYCDGETKNCPTCEVRTETCSSSNECEESQYKCGGFYRRCYQKSIGDFWWNNIDGVNENECGDNIDNDCDSDIDCADEDCTGDPNCQCDLTSATITDTCPIEGCSVGDSVGLSGNLDGYCDSVNKLIINVSGSSAGKICSMNLSIPCANGVCDDDYMFSYIPPDCAGIEVGPIHAWAYKGTDLISDTDDIGDETFIFASDISELQEIFVYPPYLELNQLERFYLYVDAYYDDGNIIDISTHDYTNYWSDIVRVLTNPKNRFWAHDEGEGVVRVRFPVDYYNPNWPYEEDNAIIKVHGQSPLDCSIIPDDTYIIPECGDDGCDETEEIILNVKMNKKCIDNYNVNKLTFFAIGDSSCGFYTLSVPLSVSDCSGPGNFYTCTKNFPVEEIPSGCEGKTLWTYEALIYDGNDILIDSALNQIYPGFGEFQFYTKPPQEPDYIVIDKKGAEISVGQFIEYEVWAYLEGVDPWEVTSHEATTYESDDPLIAEQSTPKNKFEGVGEGEATITAKYPVGYNPKEDSSLLYVYPDTPCDVLDAKITSYCGESGEPNCNNGDKIEIEVLVKEECLDPSHMAKIEMDAFNESGCNVNMDVAISLSDCDNSGAERYCRKNWSVDIPLDCGGEIVTADFVTVRDWNNEFLASLQGDPDFGWAKFVDDPDPLRAIIFKPEHGDEYEIDSLIDFEQISVGEIDLWKWYFRYIIDQPPWNWELFHTAPPGEANISYNFKYANSNAQAGTYEINLTVENEADFDDQGNILIYLIDDHTPIAKITQPEMYEILYNSKVDPFDGSDTYDPDGDPSDLTLTWKIFDNGGIIPIEGLFDDVKEIWYEYSQAKPEPFNVTLKATDLDSYSSTTYVKFKIAYCEHNLDYIFAGKCIGEDNLYCNEEDCDEYGVCDTLQTCDCDNCPDYQFCNPLYGTCEDRPGSGDCEDLAPAGDCHEGGCYWDEIEPPSPPPCLSCVDDNPISCSGYDNGGACGADICDKGNKDIGCDGSTFVECDDPSESCIPGQGPECCIKSGCMCKWSDTKDKCNVAFDLDDHHSGQGNEPMHCEYSIDPGDCSDNCDINGKESRLAKYVLDEFESGGECPAGSTECILCGLLFRPLPFFSWWNALVVMSLLIIFYVIFRKKFNLS